MDIERVDRTLRNALLLIEAGEWDRLSEFADELVSVLHSTLSWKLDAENANTRQQVAQIIGMLGTAMTACSERQGQIAPLLDALTRAENRLPQP